MADTAAHLVDRVLPRVPVRQWVLTVPRPIRYLLARDSKLLSGALRIFVSEVFRNLRRRSGIRLARDCLCGGVTAVQRFGGALNLNIHFHTLVLDGVYVRDPSTGTVRFRRVPPPSPEDLDRLLARVRERVYRFLARRGYAVSVRPGAREEIEGPAEDPSLLDVVQAASIREWIGLSDEARLVPVLGSREQAGAARPEKPFCVHSDGFSLHAAVRIRAGDREGLERVCRYVLRPPFAGERLERLPDGRVLYEFRRARPDGGLARRPQADRALGEAGRSRAASAVPPRALSRRPGPPQPVAETGGAGR